MKRLGATAVWVAAAAIGGILHAPAAETPQAFEVASEKMLQTLLADRFKLVVRHETKEVPAYALTPGKGGPKLTRPKAEDQPGLGMGRKVDPNGQMSIRITGRKAEMRDFAFLLLMTARRTCTGSDRAHRRIQFRCGVRAVRLGYRLHRALPVYGSSGATGASTGDGEGSAGWPGYRARREAFGKLDRKPIRSH